MRLLLKMTQYVSAEKRYQCYNCAISCTKREMNHNVLSMLTCPRCDMPMIFRIMNEHFTKRSVYAVS